MCVVCVWMWTCLCFMYMYMVDVWILQFFSILYVGESYFIWTQSLKIKLVSPSLTCGIKGGPLVLSSIRALMGCRIWALNSSYMLAYGCIWPVLVIMEQVHHLLIPYLPSPDIAIKWLPICVLLLFYSNNMYINVLDFKHEIHIKSQINELEVHSN